MSYSKYLAENERATFNAIDDDDAASNGTQLHVAWSEGAGPFLTSVLAGSVDVVVQDAGASGQKRDAFAIVDGTSAIATLYPLNAVVYYDEDAENDSKFRADLSSLCNHDIYVATMAGRTIKIVNDSSPSTLGVILYCDDDATIDDRFLYVSPTNADSTFQTSDQATAGFVRREG